MRVWSDADKAAVRRMAEDEKLTASMIAPFFGVRRNAIIGLCRRNAIRLPGLSSNPGRAKVERKPRRAPLAAILPPPVLGPQEEPLPPPATAVVFGNLRQYSAGINQCRNFLPGHSGNGGSVCATDTQPGEAYCARCREKMYRPVTLGRLPTNKKHNNWLGRFAEKYAA